MKGQFWRNLKKVSPLILTVVGSAGVVATAIFTAKATPLYVNTIKTKEEEKEEPLTTMEKVKVALPIYAPATGIGLATIAAIVGSNVLSMKQNLSLAATCTLLQKNFKTYKNKVKDIFGEEADQKVVKEIAKDNIPKIDPRQAMIEDLCFWYEPNTGEYFWESEANVLRAENEVNRRVNSNGICTLMEYCNLLKIEPPPGSENLGWCYDDFRDNWDEFWVYFDHEFVDDPDEDVPPYWIIHTPISPEYDFVREERPMPRLYLDDNGCYAYDVR